MRVIRGEDENAVRDFHRRHRVGLGDQHLVAGEVGDIGQPRIGVFLVTPGDLAGIAAGGEQHHMALVGNDHTCSGSERQRR